MNTQKTLIQLSDEIHNLAREKGWYDVEQTDDAFLERACNNLHDEISELHEAWRNNKLRDPCDKAKKMEELGLKPLTCIEEEMADIVIRVLDDCARLKIDIQTAIETKHEYNKTRPARHGGKRS